MSLPPSDSDVLRARLEWLRLLGVDWLPRSSPAAETATPGAPGAGSPPARRSAPATEPASESTALPVHAGQAPAPRAPVVQVGLFGGEEPVEAPAGGQRRRAGAGGAEAQPPLASARAPEAPNAATALDLIRQEIGDCRRCRLCEGRTNIVFGVGSPNARLMFVGEGPGVDEDRQGEPFVGRAGQLLTKMIEAMGLRREDVYIANIVKCRPPENRTPLPDEVATCSPFLFQQIAAIKPRVVVCLGTPAAQTVLGTRSTITHIRGTFRDVAGTSVMPTFHPAYLLRNPAAKKEVWDDMKQVMARLKTEG
jgi:DNA polymerase